MNTHKFSPYHNPYRHTIGQGDSIETIMPMHCSTPTRLSQSSSSPILPEPPIYNRFSIFTEKEKKYTAKKARPHSIAFCPTQDEENKDVTETSLIDQLSTLDNSQLVKSLEDSILENSQLKSELASKDKRLKKCKAQIKALIQLEEVSSDDEEIFSSNFKAIKMCSDSSIDEDSASSSSSSSSENSENANFRRVSKSVSRFMLFQGK